MARIIVFVIFGGFGLVMLYVGLIQHFRQKRLLLNARPIEVEIIKSEVRSSTSSNTDRRLGRDNSTASHRPDIRFRYTIAGQTHESDLIHPTIIARGYASHSSAAEALKPFPLGAKVQAWADPMQPDKAFLINEKSAAPLVFIILGVILPPIAWFAGALV